MTNAILCMVDNTNISLDVKYNITVALISITMLLGVKFCFTFKRYIDIDFQIRISKIG